MSYDMISVLARQSEELTKQDAKLAAQAARIEKLEAALREISELRWSPGKTTYQELLADAQYTAEVALGEPNE